VHDGREHRHFLGPEPVDQHCVATPRRAQPSKCGGDAPAGDVVLEDVSLDVDFLPGRLDGRFEGRKILPPTHQEPDFVALAEQDHTPTMVADNAAGSQNRDQGNP
jgi:hypothetical protein